MRHFPMSEPINLKLKKAIDLKMNFPQSFQYGGCFSKTNLDYILGFSVQAIFQILFLLKNFK